MNPSMLDGNHVIKTDRNDFLRYFLVIALLLSYGSSFSTIRFNNYVSTRGALRTCCDTQLSLGTSLHNQIENSNDHIIKQRLSRPERKALERSKKQEKQSNCYNNKRTTKKLIEIKKSAEGPTTSDRNRYIVFKSETSAVSLLESTENEILQAIKRVQRKEAVDDLLTINRFLLEQSNDRFPSKVQGSLLARLAVASLQLNQYDVANSALTIRRNEHFDGIVSSESAAIIRGLLRVGNVTEAICVLEGELPLSPSLEAAMEKARIQDDVDTLQILCEVLQHRTLSLITIARYYFAHNEPELGVSICSQIAKLGPIVRKSDYAFSIPWDRLLEDAARCQSWIRDIDSDETVTGSRTNPSASSSTKTDRKVPCNVVYSVLKAMTTFPSENSDRIYELLANSLVRRVVFVTGAVNVDGLPKPDRGEAAFIGRSNVGKSSLVNMITNRKSLAFTSKQPGKTQQINFFAVNDKVGLEKEIRYGDDVPGTRDRDSFYIVDLPGFGYAKAPEKQRMVWLQFMHQYLSERKSLKVVFHLIDSRLGPTADDANIMAEVGKSLSSSASYVVVLTKADKNVKGVTSQNVRGKVPKSVMESLRTVMNQSGINNAPVLVTSSETKLGRDDMWRYLRLAAET